MSGFGIRMLIIFDMTQIIIQMDNIHKNRYEIVFFDEHWLNDPFTVFINECASIFSTHFMTCFDSCRCNK